MPSNNNKAPDATLRGNTSEGNRTVEGAALLVSGSPAGIDAEILCELATKTGFILAVDAGAEQLAKADIVPDLLIGDFDSVSKSTLAHFETEGVPMQSYDPYKNATDIELGIETLSARGYQCLIAANVLGGRTDHALGALGALAWAAHNNDMKVVLRDNSEAYYFLSTNAASKMLELSFGDGGVFGGGLPPLLLPTHPLHVSLIAWGGCVTVSLQGAEWPLDNHVLSPYSARGVSNILRSSVLRLEAHEGNGVVVLALSC